MAKNKNHELDKARFDEPLYQNYDLYDTEGVDGKAKQGPGTGFYEHMGDYKSVADFLKKKRKKNKSKKASLRIKILKAILKQAIDFPIDDSFKDPISPEENTSIQVALPFGGLTDEYLPENDQEDKSPDQLNFGRDFQNNREEPNVEEELNEIINPSQPPLLGLPDGMEPEEVDADKTLSKTPSGYGTTESGNTLYDNMSF
jgi:hypothetical protein